MSLTLYILTGLCLYTDLKQRKIYNLVTFPGIILGLIFNCYLNNFWPGFLFGIKGLLLGIIIFFIPFAIGGLGAGDLKMLGMIGAFWGLEKVLWTGLFGAIAGGLLAVLQMIFNRSTANPALNYLKNFGVSFLHHTPLPKPEQKNINKRYFPYSLAIILGMVLTILFKS